MFGCVHDLFWRKMAWRVSSSWHINVQLLMTLFGMKMIIDAKSNVHAMWACACALARRLVDECITVLKAQMYVFKMECVIAVDGDLSADAKDQQGYRGCTFFIYINCIKGTLIPGTMLDAPGHDSWTCSLVKAILLDQTRSHFAMFGLQNFHMITKEICK